MHSAVQVQVDQFLLFLYGRTNHKNIFMFTFCVWPSSDAALFPVHPLSHLFCNTSEPGHEKMSLMSYAINKGADQPAHPRSL